MEGLKNDTAPRIVIARPRRGRAISGRHCRFVPVAVKMAKTKSQPVAVVTAQPLAALPPYGCGVPFTGGERHWQLQIPAHSADSTRYCRGADSRARRGTHDWYRLALKRLQPQVCHCEEAAGRRGNLGKAVTFLPEVPNYPAKYCEIPTSLRSSE